MDINRINLETVFRNLRKDFDGTYDTVLDKRVDRLSLEIPMTTASLRFDFLGDDPEFREWIGQRKLHEVASKSYEVTYKTWELTMRMLRNDITDDNIGLYSTKAKTGGDAAARLKPREVWRALQDGISRNCYDNQFYFDTDHPVGEDGDVTATSNYLNAGGASAASPWYVLDTSRVLKPLVWLNREAPFFQAFFDMSNIHTFMQQEYLFGGMARGAAHYGPWQCALRNEGVLNVANLRASRNQMTNLTGDRKHDDGTRRKLGINPNLLIVGSANRDRAEILLKQPIINSAEDPLQTSGAPVNNPMLGAFELMVVDYLP